MMNDEAHEHEITTAAEGILTVENAPLPLAVLRRDGTFLLANRAMRSLLGYEQNELDGRYFSEFFDIPGCPARLHHVLETGVNPEIACLARHKAGHTVPVRTS